MLIDKQSGQLLSMNTETDYRERIGYRIVF